MYEWIMKEGMIQESEIVHLAAWLYLDYRKALAVLLEMKYEVYQYVLTSPVSFDVAWFVEWNNAQEMIHNGVWDLENWKLFVGSPLVFRLFMEGVTQNSYAEATRIRTLGMLGITEEKSHE